MQITATSDKA